VQVFLLEAGAQVTGSYRRMKPELEMLAEEAYGHILIKAILLMKKW